MKKSILIFSTLLVGLSLMAFSFLNRNKTSVVATAQASSTAPLFEYDLANMLKPEADFELVYKVGSRYMYTISKTDLHQAKSILDILPQNAAEKTGTFQKVKVTLYDDGEGVSELGDQATLNAAQIDLLQTTNYASSLQVSAIYQDEQTKARRRTYDSLIYYLSITPEQEAEFAEGYDALIRYLKENSKEETAIIRKDQLKPGQFSFIVTKEGTISQVELKSSCGYKSVDQALLDLIEGMPGKWKPAIDADGNKIDQELIFFFGVDGC